VAGGSLLTGHWGSWWLATAGDQWRVATRGTGDWWWSYFLLLASYLLPCLVLLATS
jgi:hypothetical protein